ncbi:hypothetical protein INR49_001694, partial [Caranx melampygus]
HGVCLQHYSQPLHSRLCQHLTFECDLTRLNTSTIWEYGKYTGRVRAQLGSDSSAWVESNPSPWTKTLLYILLFSVFLSHYRFTHSFSLLQRGNIGGFKQKSYTAKPCGSFWPGPKTKYCVQVQINTDSNPHPSKPSAVVCESTGTDESPWTEAMITFVLMAVGVVLVVVGVGGWGCVPGKYRPDFLSRGCPASASQRVSAGTTRLHHLPGHEKLPSSRGVLPSDQDCHRPQDCGGRVPLEGSSTLSSK